MHQINRLIKMWTLGFFCALTLSGCGGGGDSTPSGPVYSGLTTPAALTQANAQEITLDAMDGSEISSIAGGSTAILSVNAVGAQSSLGAQAVAGTVLKLSSLISTLDLSVFPDTTAAMTQTASEPGPCGGNLSGTVSVDDNSGAFSATFTFSSYRDYDTASLTCMGTGSLINGSISMTSNSQIIQAGTFMSMSFSAFSVVDGMTNISLAGAASINFLSATQSQTTLNLVASDNLVGKTFKVVNYQLIATDYGSYQTEDISGRFYSSPHGYVDILTQVPVETELNAPWPRAGVVSFTGAAGAAVTVTFGATSAVGSGADSQGNIIAFEYIYGSN